jgi:hypothetical protein
MYTTNNANLFTEITAAEAATVNGGFSWKNLVKRIKNAIPVLRIIGGILVKL